MSTLASFALKAPAVHKPFALPITNAKNLRRRKFGNHLDTQYEKAVARESRDERRGQKPVCLFRIHYLDQECVNPTGSIRAIRKKGA